MDFRELPELARVMRASGVTRATFDPQGQLVCVELGDEPRSDTAPAEETPQDRERAAEQAERAYLSTLFGASVG